VKTTSGSKFTAVTPSLPRPIPQSEIPNPKSKLPLSISRPPHDFGKPDLPLLFQMQITGKEPRVLRTKARDFDPKRALSIGIPRELAGFFPPGATLLGEFTGAQFSLCENLRNLWIILVTRVPCAGSKGMAMPANHDAIFEDWRRNAAAHEDANFAFLRSLKFADHPRETDELAAELHRDAFRIIDCTRCANCCKTISHRPHRVERE
jgi:hypothetical protein